MPFTRLHVTLAAGLIAVAGTAGAVVMSGSAAAGPAAARPAAAAKAAPVVLVNQCTGKGQTRPGPNVPLPGCMTSSELLGSVHWSSWTSVAFGGGNLEVNNCTPSSGCGPSKYTKYPILIVLWRAERWSGKRGTDYFSRMTWIYTGKRPSHAPGTQTVVVPPAAQ
jgi:hypothetical protein